MITPRFQLTQTETTISIEIRAPYCSLKDLDVHADENDFMFACRPYYLRLNLPGKIISEDESPKSSSFNSDDGLFIFTYEKTNRGEEFPDLDLITKLLCEKVVVNDGGRKIEVLSSTGSNSSSLIEENDAKYGFGMRGGYNLTCVLSEFADVFEIDPHEVKLEDRKVKRVEVEKSAFNADYYIADIIDNDEIIELIRCKNPWVDLSPDFKFNASELDFLKDLQNVEYALSETQRNYCLNSLLEILYAYCYDRRTTFYEGTCESGWAVNKLSASLCFFEGFENPKEAIVCGFKRSLIYPLYRNFDLSLKVLEDLKILLKLGEKFIIRCLIDLHGIFLKGEGGRYVLNNLFVVDYIRYSMKWDKKLWSGVVETVFKMEIEKSDLDLELPVIGKYLDVIREESLENCMENLGLDSDDDTVSEDSDDSSTEEDSSSSDE